MRKLLLILVITLFGSVLVAQPVFNLGLKGGLTNSDFSLSREQYNSESILNYHIGAFGRVGWGRVFLQPELYFSARGGEFNFDLSGNPVDAATKFDYTTVDVPLLAGVYLYKGDFIKVRAMGGPLFSFVTARDVDRETRFGVDDFRENFFGWQYGAGVDIWFITLDARFENSSGSVIQTSDFNARNKTFLLSAGIKLF
jgi:opacity protein-like surface antigen